MKFKIIDLEDLRESISNLLMNHFPYDFTELKKTVFLKIDEKMFREFKNRPIKKEEVINLVNLDETDTEKELIRIRNAWNECEEIILKKIKERTGISISTENIICSIDPYTSHGFYGEDNISIGADFDSESAVMVISHELFHIFYWEKLKELGIFKKKLGEESFKEWALAEVTDYLLQKDLQNLWPNTTIELYPDIKKVYEKVRNLWKENNFEEYLIQSYKIIENL